VLRQFTPGPHPSQSTSPLDPGDERWPMPLPLAGSGPSNRAADQVDDAKTGRLRPYLLILANNTTRLHYVDAPAVIRSNCLPESTSKLIAPTAASKRSASGFF
jgi:hypothetical protein